ncbi:MAG: HlyD family secretion protein [Pikeienuella sp.]|uniref:HlyD family secretion protein n=1 Tax=Pikeienuella sp. TaxID=2831957 RepID=UPI00391D59A7
MARIGRLFAWLRRALTRTLLMVVGPVAIAVGGYQFWMASGRHVTTENAYVKADIIIVASEVSGLVVEVGVVNNQRFAKGEVLFRLDPTRFEIERDRRAADLAAARLRVEALKARHRMALAQLQAATRDGVFLHEDLDRTRALAQGGAVSNVRLRDAERALAQAESRSRLAVEEIGEALAELAGDPDGSVDAHPEVRRHLAALREAEHDLAAATVRAPADAFAANVRLQPGEYVEDGAAVMTLIDAERFWIEANLKETDLTHLREGQSAVFEVDAYPGLTWSATVASLAPATGAEFALLPPQNASGNWVKVVQRVPVTLEIEPAPDQPTLRAGMSVAVSIDTGWARPTPQLIDAATAWIRGEPQ